MVAYVDVRRLMNSPFHDRLRQLQRTSPTNVGWPRGSDRDRFETDVDGVLIASTAVDVRGERAQGSLLIARGRFDAVRIEGVMREQGRSGRPVHGAHVSCTLTNETNDAALAFAEPGLLMFGPQASVRGALDTKAGAAAGIASNREFMTLVSDVERRDRVERGEIGCRVGSQAVSAGSL